MHNLVINRVPKGLVRLVWPGWLLLLLAACAIHDALPDMPPNLGDTATAVALASATATPAPAPISP